MKDSLFNTLKNEFQEKQDNHLIISNITCKTRV